MVSKEKLDRINELARKKKTEGLTKEESEERSQLHAEYLQAVRDSLKAQLDSIKFIEDLQEELTEEEKNNIDYLTEKLGKEYEEDQKKTK